jgi:branched-subunit amino acid ABC-type transport system permease component
MFTQLFINSIIAGSIYTLIAFGFYLIYSTTKFFHFARAAVKVSGNWRIVFSFNEGNAYDVNYIDYH